MVIRNQRGFTLLELVVAAAFMGIVVVAVAGLFIGLRQINRAANNYTIAVEVGQQMMETVRNTAYSNIPIGTTNMSSLLTNYPSLLSPRSASETVSYITTTGASSVTDVGMKQVVVAVSYTDRTGVKNVQFSTWVSNKGINP